MTASAVRTETTPLDDIRHLASLPVWHRTAPSAASVMGLSRDSAYQAAAAGELPVIRVGRLLRVPVPALRRMLGDI